MLGHLLSFGAVALGGAAGALARFALSALIDGRARTALPLGTLVVNVSGAVAIGLLSAFLEGPPAAPWSLLVTGLLGSYTTVSAFSLQTLVLLRGDRRGTAAAYILLSLLLCLAGAGAGRLAGLAFA